MFGGFGSRFAKFGTGGGGRSIASPADLLQLFKRGSEDGAMIDELDNTTDLELANVNALTGSTSFVTFNGEPTDSSQTIVLETTINAGASVPDVDDLFGQSAGTGTGRSWARLRSTGAIQTFIGGGVATLAPAGSILPNTTHKLQLCISPLHGEVTLFIDGIAQNRLTRSIEAADGNFQLKRGHSGTLSIANVTMGSSSLYKREDNVIDLIVLCGQSNALGQSGVTAPSNLDFERIHRWAYQFDETTPNATNINLENIDTRWGAELGMADAAFNDDGRTVAVLKVTKGSTLLDGDWSPTQGMYEAFKTRYSAFESALVSDGYTIGRTTFVWVHGESDSNSESSANSYLTNFDAMISGWESEVGFSPDAIYITQTPLKNGAERTYQSTVDAAKQVIASRAGNKFFTTRDLSIQADGTHYDAAGLQTLGKRLGDAWLLENSYDKRYIFNAPLQEGSGSTAYDVSGNGNHGTIYGATWTTEDGIESWNHEYGFASAFANLDGADNKYLKFPLTGLDQSTFDMTMWLEVTDRTASINKWFFSNGASFNNRGIEIKATSSNRLIFSNYFSGGRVDLTTPDATIDGKMYKIDVHFESGNSYLVIDGVKGTVNTTTFTPAFTGTEDFAYIFARNNGLNAGRGIIYKLNINGEEKVLTDAELIGSPTRYNIPALNTKTKQVATFDGVADRLGFTAHTTAVGDVFDFEFDLLSNPDGAPGNHRALLSDSGVRYIALLDNDDGRIVVRGSSIRTSTGAIKVADGMSTLKVTIDSASQVSVSINGGAAETLATDFTGIELNRLMAASAGNVRYVNANVASFSITNSSGNKVVGYDFQNDIGTTNIVDISGNGNDGELDYEAGGLESFWGTRVEDASGTLVSADYATGNTSISNPAALDNDSEVDLVQTDSVFVSGTANFWSADGAAQDEKTFDELITHANTRNGYHRVWVKVLNGRVLTIAQYDLDKNFLPSEVLKNERYFGGTSAALRDVNGDFITDGNGYVIFAA